MQRAYFVQQHIMRSLMKPIMLSALTLLFTVRELIVSVEFSAFIVIIDGQNCQTMGY